MAQIRRKGPNKYEISVFIGRDAEGKRVFHYETFNADLKLCAVALSLPPRRSFTVMSSSGTSLRSKPVR